MTTDLDRSGTRYLILGSYVYGEVDWFAYTEYLDEPGSARHLWCDLSADDRDRYRERARTLLAQFEG